MVKQLWVFVALVAVAVVMAMVTVIYFDGNGAVLAITLLCTLIGCGVLFVHAPDSAFDHYNDGPMT